jgi:hypothetical protein
METDTKVTPEQQEEAGLINAVVASTGKDPTSLTVEEPKPKTEEPKVEEPKPKVEEPKPKVEEPPKVVEVDFKAEYAKLQKELGEIKEKLSKPPEVKPVEVPKTEEPEKPWVPRGAISEEEVDKLFEGGKSTVEVINKLATNIREDMAEVTVKYIDRVLGERLKPLTGLQQQQEQQELQKRSDEFVQKYPDLKEDVDVAREQAMALIGELTKNGQKLKDWDEFYSVVAQRTRPIVEKLRAKYGQKPVVTPSGAPPVPKTPGATPLRAPAPGEEDEENDAISAVIKGSV